MRTRLALALGALTTALPASALAQVEYQSGFDPDQFHAPADPASVSLLESATPLGRMDYAAGLTLRLGGPPLQACIRDNGAGDCMVEGDVVSTRLTSDLTAVFGFGRFDVRAILQVVLYQGTDFDPAEGSESLSAAGVGDLRLGGKIGLAKVADLAFAYDAELNLPWSGGSNFIGDDGLIIDQRVLAQWGRDRIGALAGFGYRFRSNSVQLGNLYVNDELLWQIAGQYEVMPDKLTAGAAVFGRIGVVDDPDPMEGFEASPGSEEKPVELLFSGRYWLNDRVSLEGGAGAGLNEGYGAPNFRLLVGARFSERKPPAAAPIPAVIGDADSDGLNDDVDKCVEQAEDKDGFADDDGCPEADNDADGLADADDNCPNDAETKNGFMDQDGCPDADADGDGIADADDKCADKPEDVDGFEDTDGCPEADNDGDGLADATDQCPLKAEDLDSIADEDGCPEDDADNDGIVDATDKCPTEAEVYNGNADEDGCADAGRAVAVVTGSAIQMNEMVFFRMDSARFRSRSHKVLDVIVQVMRNHQHIRVKVVGHTDDVGPDTYNQQLSEQRAEAVMKYLINKGIDASRLEYEGKGESAPLEAGTSRKAREKNRRVEFKIISATP